MKKLDLLPSRSPRRLLSVFGILLLFAMPSAATWDEGVASFHAHDYPAAAEAFARVVERSPEAHQAHYMLGLSLLKQEQTAAARRSFEKAVASVSDSAEYRLALASTEVTLGRHDDALSTLREIDPKRVEKASHRESLATLLGKTAPRASDPAEAERIVRRGLAADGTSVPLLLAHASLAEKRGAMPERAEAYARAYLASPEEAPRLGEKAARALLNVGHGSRDETGGKAYRRAVEVTSRLVREEPGGASYFLAGQAAMGSRDYDGARQWFEKALAADPPVHRAHLELGKVLLVSERLEAALAQLERALESETDPRYLQDIHSQRGSALRHQERFVEAAAAYEQAGKSKKVQEMHELEAMRLQNVQYAKAKAECAEKERRVAELRDQNRDLEGTEAWRDLERKITEILAGCEQFHDEA